MEMQLRKPSVSLSHFRFEKELVVVRQCQLHSRQPDDPSCRAFKNCEQRLPGLRMALSLPGNEGSAIYLERVVLSRWQWPQSDYGIPKLMALHFDAGQIADIKRIPVADAVIASI